MTVRKRGNSWHYQFMVANQRYYGVLPKANNKTEAKTLEDEERRKVRHGRHNPDLVPETNGLDRFDQFVKDVYLKYSKDNKASWRHDEFRCQMLCEYFGGKRFSEITPMQVASFINQRLATKVRRHRQTSPATRLRSPVTVHKELILVSSIFRMAMDERVATDNPVNRVPRAVRRKLKARNKRRCNLDYDKERQLIENGLSGRNARLLPVVLFDLHTGLRLGELCRLERDHVNLDQEPKWFEIDGEWIEVPKDCIIVAKSKTEGPCDSSQLRGEASCRSSTLRCDG